MRIFDKLRYTIIELVRIFYLEGVPASLKNIWNIFLEFSAGYGRKNYHATLVIPPGTSVASIVTNWCNRRDDEYILHQITRQTRFDINIRVVTTLFCSFDKL